MALPLMQNSGRGTLKHLLKLTEKKPTLKLLYDNLADTTVIQIESSTWPKWVRTLLLKEKEKADRKAAGFLEPSVIAFHMMEAHIDVDKEVWSVYQLTTPLKIGVKFQIEAEEGDIVALTPNEVVVNTIAKIATTAQLESILDDSVKIGDMSPEEYRERVRNYVNDKY